MTNDEHDAKDCSETETMMLTILMKNSEVNDASPMDAAIVDADGFLPFFFRMELCVFMQQHVEVT